MMTITILAVVLVVAVPNIRDMIVNNRLASQANNFIAALTVARSEAIKRRETIIVQSNSGANWALGWQVIDPDDTVEETADEIIREFGELQGGSTFSADSSITQVDYAASGTLGGGLAAQTFQLGHPECEGDQHRTISIGATGRASVARVNCP
jgi:type IV fimbrial biogenesis protein FimT